MNRRNFLVRSSALLAASSLQAAEAARLTDCHVYLGQHPFRQLEDEQAFLQQPVTEAWAGAFEGLLHRDVAEVNRQLAQRCQASAILRPCGTINLALPDWQDDVKRCAEVHGMRVLRLHPNYHGYELKSPAFRDLLALAVKHRLLVQIVAQMEDERTQHPQVRVAPVDLQPLPAIMKEIKEARVMVLNANAAMALKHLQDCPNTWLDFAMIEGVGGVENLLKTWPLERLVFGSFAPVFYWDSARLKMQESALNDEQTRAIQWRNASALLI
ncbi:MAG: amidohydrolase family protein [Prosthecobacter sp.]|uniref:amidohydrolase family protein n=1 Tax=Prosthecobacter sp. TaxID=1965333 RepID=UPI0038FEF1C7